MWILSLLPVISVMLPFLLIQCIRYCIYVMFRSLCCIRFVHLNQYEIQKLHHSLS